MKYDLTILADYISKGLVIGQSHPTLPLAIFNYSRECQYEGLWDDITLNMRGTILDTKGNVIAKPFPKFFNYEEHTAENSKLPPIPNETFEVYEKMDGSLGIFFYYEGEWHMATRGSFTSEQAIKGMEIAMRYNYDKICVPGFTYLFEIIYPENRIVVDYGKEERLVLLGIMNPKGEELPYEEIADDGWDIVMKYKTWGEDWKTLKKEISKDNEGYVIRFSGGMRMKIKGDEYVRLHRILTNFSTKDIWELLRNNEQLEPFLERVPDEFDAWVKEVVRDLKYSFFNISDMVGKMYDYFRYGKYNDKEVEPTKKEFAEYVMKQADHLRPVLFAMWDNNNERVNDIIWKLVKPKYEKPFKKDENN
jgi:T4 RnlA family RNA ligase